jgi:hypothetical protein
MPSNQIKMVLPHWRTAESWYVQTNTATWSAHRLPGVDHKQRTCMRLPVSMFNTRNRQENRVWYGESEPADKKTGNTFLYTIPTRFPAFLHSNQRNQSLRKRNVRMPIVSKQVLLVLIAGMYRLSSIQTCETRSWAGMVSRTIAHNFLANNLS